ncbi:hypothetical protein [Helicobacter heilmannii]|uniref:hypothetical protein n=1 Tax=Helicobacter heilmannii TaxID=35817 RepID=UPI0012E1F7F7|nr:hypothetical protein [Helicobacter heilmannii]
MENIEDIGEGLAILLVLFLLLWAVIWPCCAIVALKCVGASAEWPTEQLSTQPRDHAPLDSHLEQFVNSLVALEEEQRMALLKTKTSKEIAQIQAYLENLPLAQQIPLKKSLKRVLEELENI